MHVDQRHGGLRWRHVSGVVLKQAGLGKLIGMRTWGGLVGISGGTSLIDRASVTTPHSRSTKKMERG